MFQACSSGKHIERDVDYMIGFSAGHVQFEDGTVAVDAFRQADLPHHLLYESQSTTADGLRLLSEFQLCGRTSQHGLLHVALLIFNSAMPLSPFRIQLSS